MWSEPIRLSCEPGAQDAATTPSLDIFQIRMIRASVHGVPSKSSPVCETEMRLLPNGAAFLNSQADVKR